MKTEPAPTVPYPTLLWSRPRPANVVCTVQGRCMRLWEACALPYSAVELASPQSVRNCLVLTTASPTPDGILMSTTLFWSFGFFH